MIGYTLMYDVFTVEFALLPNVVAGKISFDIHVRNFQILNHISSCEINIFQR